MDTTDCQGEYKCIEEMDDGTVIVRRGPMLMSIFVSNGKIPKSTLAKEGAEKALEVLDTLARFRKVITKKIGEIGSIEVLPPIVRRMVLAAQKFEDPTVTPLIAVAGAGADEVADFIFNIGKSTKVIVNNGGDIAIRIKNHEEVKVGIKTDLTIRKVTHILTVRGTNGIAGVATSGFGGRSFTRGIANAAVAMAADATSADVAATLIGNATDIESHNIKKALARDLYEFTDIPDLRVTKSIGLLEPSEVKQALDRGMRKAETFQEKGLIIGTFLAVKDQFTVSKPIFPFIQQIIQFS
jgi:ApbE superfamily uncharacterized protein (UPF0280 family)